MKNLRVDLGKNSYDILIKRGLLNEIGQYIQNYGEKVFIITDDNVAPLYLDVVEDQLLALGIAVKALVLPSGEKTKSFDTLPTIYNAMLEFKLNRSDLIITLGGGVVGDLGGFAAATYMRGVDFIQIPTTLLAQVDSSVGGKVAVDLPQGKNLVGCFYQPKMVLIDPDLLVSLSEKFFRDGMGEVVKYACITSKKLFELLESIDGRQQFMTHADDIIAECCDIKRKIVEVDEKDTGERMLLNFGHTFGHALEKYNKYEGFSHGEAIAIGMVLITEISENNGQSAVGTTKRLVEMLMKFSLPVACSDSVVEVAKAITNDKKNFGNKLTVVLLKEIGESFLYQTTAEYFLK